ncbi:hypothetical protein D3C78_1403150 [compost metagenome]
MLRELTRTFSQAERLAFVAAAVDPDLACIVRDGLEVGLLDDAALDLAHHREQALGDIGVAVVVDGHYGLNDEFTHGVSPVSVAGQASS